MEFKPTSSVKINASAARVVNNGGLLSTSPGQAALSPPKALRAGPRLATTTEDLTSAARDTASPPPNYVVNYSVNYEDLEFYEHLGSGRFGSVSRALLKSRNIIVAVKKVESLGQEVSILSQLSHRNIVRFYGVFTNVVQTPHARQLQFGIITEYCENGSLYDLLKRIRPQISPQDPTSDDTSESGLNFANILQWAADIARGMNYLHSEAPVQIIHRDLKSTNVLLSRDWMCKICDFGSSRTRNRDNSIISVAGTPAWMSPELIRGEANFNSGCDTWSFGVVLWELLTCEQPFKGLDHYQIMFVVGSRSEHPPIPNRCPQSFQDLLKRCWSKDPLARPGFSELVVELAKLLTDDDLPSELAEFTSSTARRLWLMEVEQELARVKLLEQSLEEREHVVAEREKQLAEQKRILDLQLQRLTPSASQGHLYASTMTPIDRLDVLNWSEIDVGRWVRQLDNFVDHFRGLGKYANLFEANHISGRRLLLLSKGDLRAMGITSLGHQNQFIDEINFLRIASQMVVDFPPLQITSAPSNDLSRQNSVLLTSSMNSDAVFQVGEEGSTQSSSPLTNPSTPTVEAALLPQTQNNTLGSVGNGHHTPLSINVSNSNSFILVGSREFFVNLAVGMYTFPTTISESGQVKEAVEYRVFVDGHVSFDPSTVSSTDDSIALNDLDLTLDIANIFSSVFVIFDPGLPTERRICAATGATDSSSHLEEPTAPYIAKETVSSKFLQPFSSVEIEIALRQPYCCCNKTKISSNSESAHSSHHSSPSRIVVTRASDGQSDGGSEENAAVVSKSAYEFIGVICKRLAANFNAPITTWTECVTQLNTNGNDEVNSVHFSLNSPLGDDHSMSLASTCTNRSVKGLSSPSLKQVPHSPRHLSLASITSPVNENDPVAFFSDARRNSVSQLTSPNDARPSSPAAALIGQQVKVANERGLPHGLFPPASNNHHHHQLPSSEKTYASVAAAAKHSMTNGLDMAGPLQVGASQGTYHGHHPTYHRAGNHHHNHYSQNSVSPAFRHAIKNNQRQHNRNNSGSSDGSTPGSGPRSSNRQYFSPSSGFSQPGSNVNNTPSYRGSGRGSSSASGGPSSTKYQ